MRWKKLSAVLLTFSLLAAYFYLDTPQQAQAAAGPQILLTRNTESAATASSRFLPLNGNGVVNSFATSTLGVFPIAGTFGNMTVTVDSAPGGAASWVITLDENNASTGLTCTIGSGETSCTASGSYVASANRVFSIKATASGGPAPTYIRGSIQFTPTTSGHTAILAQPNGPSTSAQRFSPLVNAQVSFNTPETARQSILPTGGTLGGMYASLNTAPGAGKQYEYTLRVNNATSSPTVTCTVADTNTACSDLSNTDSIAANDIVSLSEVPAGTPGVVTNGFGFDFVPTATGDFIFIGGTTVADHATEVRYVQVPGTGISAIEASTTMAVQAMTVTGISAYVGTAPGAAKTRTYEVNKNGVATGLQCIVSGTDKTCSGSGSVSFSDGDTLSVSDTPAGSPSTTSFASVSLVANANTGGGGGGTPANFQVNTQMFINTAVSI